MSKEYKIAWILSIVALIIGLLLISKEVSTYSTDEYWVAKNYRHVYEQASGKIVDYIEDDETCKIKHGEIIVTRMRAGIVGSAFGWILTLIAGSWIVGLIILESPNPSTNNSQNFSYENAQESMVTYKKENNYTDNKIPLNNIPQDSPPPSIENRNYNNDEGEQLEKTTQTLDTRPFRRQMPVPLTSMSSYKQQKLEQQKNEETESNIKFDYET